MDASINVPNRNPAALIQHMNGNTYGYVPTTYVCVIFIVIYALSTIIHTGEAVYTRKWYMLATVVLCGISELIGWGARLWSSKNILALTPFLMQISTTIFAPTFTAAANFIILGTIIKRVGPQYSRLPAPAYGLIFVTIDVVALVVQAVGGGIASSAPVANYDGPSDQATRGGNIMLGGIVVQLVEIVVSFALAAEFFYNYAHRKTVPLLIRGSPNSRSRISRFRWKWNSAQREEAQEPAQESGGPPSPPDTITGSEKQQTDRIEKVDIEEVGMPRELKIMSMGLGFSTLCLLIRSIYRTIELSNGWSGRIITTQVYFNVLDGAMVVLAMTTLNFIHPGFFL